MKTMKYEMFGCRRAEIEKLDKMKKKVTYHQMVITLNKCLALFLALCSCVAPVTNLSISETDTSQQFSHTNHQEVNDAGMELFVSNTNITTKIDLEYTSSQADANVATKRQDNRRPIWVLAHMVNSIRELDYRLGMGANAVEVDVTFGKQGEPLYTYHGSPCDCWRHCHQQENFDRYLNYVREIAIDTPTGIGQNLSLLFLDLKLDPLDQVRKENAGRLLAKSLMNNLFTTSPIHLTKEQSFHLVISINHVNDIDLIHNFMHTLETNNASYLLKQIGFDVGMNDDLFMIEKMWRKFSGTKAESNYMSLPNLWQGDGYTNCLSPFYNLERLSRALAMRDLPEGYPRKVYHWTIDLHDRIRESLLMGVDAIMTNHPERVLSVLREPEIAHDFRFASRSDDPFKKLTRRLTSRSGESARYQRSAGTTNGGFLGNLLDVFSSWLNYMREIPFLSFPVAILSRSSATNKRSTTMQTIAATSQSPIVQTITPIRLHNQPEYKIDQTIVGNSTESRNTTEQSMNNVTTPTDEVQNQQQNEFVYDGPKWYTSFVSNMLVSAMKIALPPPG